MGTEKHNEFITDAYPSHLSFVDQVYKQLKKNICNKRDTQIEKRLSELGFHFNTPNEIAAFATRHLTLVSSIENPQYKELFLNFSGENEILIASWWDTYEVIHDYNNLSHRVTIISGNPPR